MEQSKEGSKGGSSKLVLVPKINIAGQLTSAALAEFGAKELSRYELIDQTLVAQTSYGPVRRG
jgi:hypothetical protein